MEDLTGKQLGGYQIIAPLGEGGMAAVYEAYQPSIDRRIALKVLPRQFANSPDFLARFRQEGRMLAKLQHPHILPVFDFGESDGYTFIAMPLLQSGSLVRRMSGKPAPLNNVVNIISQVGGALDYAHKQGLVHRDVKPSNILLDESGNCLLTDFGIARMVESESHLTSTGVAIGTPAYISPEQGLGKTVDARSDIYSLGVVLYELVTGRAPYVAETPMAVIVKHINDPLPLPRKLAPTTPAAVERVILKALAKQPSDRFQTMAEFVDALQTAAAHGARRTTSQPKSIDTPSQPVTQPSRQRIPLLAGALVLTVEGAGVILAQTMIGRSNPSGLGAAAPSPLASQATTSIESVAARSTSAATASVATPTAMPATATEAAANPTTSPQPSPSPSPTEKPSATPEPTALPTATPGKTYKVTVRAEVDDHELGNVNCTDWKSCRDKSVGEYLVQAFPQGSVSADFDNEGYRVRRIFLRFDTSKIPPEAQIRSVVLRVYSGPFQSGLSRIHVVSSSKAEDFASGANFNRIGGESGGSATLRRSTWALIKLSDSAAPWISKGKFTKLALVHEFDLLNTLPTSNNSVTIGMSERSSTRPYIEITYLAF